MQESRLDDTQSSKLAIVYVRQSSDYQAEHNVGSQYYQRELVERARTLGARNIITIEDLGESAQYGDQRDGFDDLIKRIENYEVSLVLAADCSRIGRNMHDQGWFLGSCELTDTLISDHNRIYDMRIGNDKTALDVHGFLARNEMINVTNRLKNSRRAKAEKGDFRIKICTGYIYLGNKIVVDPDPEVCAVIQMVFDKFMEIGSASGVVKYMNNEDRKLPTRNSKTMELEWVNAYVPRVMSILRNPTYTGKITFGRFSTKAVMRKKSEPYRGKKLNKALSKRVTKVTKIPKDQWIEGSSDRVSHPAYITQEQFDYIQKKLTGNASPHRSKRRSNPGEGTSILQSIVTCGTCGRNMYTTYKDKTKPVYVCYSDNSEFSGTCQRIYTVSLEKAIVREVIKRIELFDLDILTTIEDERNKQAANAIREGTKKLQMLEKKEAVAQSNFQRLLRISPEGQEADQILLSYKEELNQAMKNTEKMRRIVKEASSVEYTPLDVQEKRDMLLLTKQIRKLWETDNILNSERREICQCLISEVRLSKSDTEFIAHIVWRDGSETRITSPKIGSQGYSTDGLHPMFNINDKLIELSKRMGLVEMAEYLNDSENYRAREGGEHTVLSISSRRARLFKKLGLDYDEWLEEEMRTDQFYSLKTAQKMLCTTTLKLRRMIQTGRLPSIITSSNRVWVQIEDAEAIRASMRRSPSEGIAADRLLFEK